MIPFPLLFNLMCRDLIGHFVRSIEYTSFNCFRLVFLQGCFYAISSSFDPDVFWKGDGNHHVPFAWGFEKKSRCVPPPPLLYSFAPGILKRPGACAQMQSGRFWSSIKMIFFYYYCTKRTRLYFFVTLIVTLANMFK